MNKSVIVTVVIVVIALVSMTRSRSPEDRTISVPDDDPAMAEAIATARKTVPELLTAIKEGVDTYCVKAPISDRNGTEHFWLSQVKYADGKFTGKIDNEPDMVKCVKLGDSYSVKEGEISDWMYLRNGKATGNVTLKALLPHMTPKERAVTKKAMGWD
jgi:uncharacterized protein YegJ (DUF2314 family)